MTVRLFAGAADIAGVRTERLAAEDLCHLFPALGQMEEGLLFAANAEYASVECDLHPGDELALIPPVSGGATS